MPYGKLQLRERADYYKQIERTAGDIEDEAWDMRTDGVDISVCIKRPDGIHISAHDGVTYEIHFDPQNESAGYYTVSGGHYKGTGTIVGVRKAETASFKHYYYIKVLSQTTHHFAWRVAINSFSTVAHEA